METETATGLGEKKFLGQIAPGNFGGKVRQAVPLSLHTPCSHTVKNTLGSKQKTDNAPTDKTERVTSAMKQGLSFQILSIFFKEIQTINAIVGLFNVLWQIAVVPQFKRHVNRSSFYIY